MPDSNGKICYAVVAGGWISQGAFMPGLEQTDNSVMTALVTGDPVKADELAALYDLKSYHYDEFDTLLRSGEIDAIYLATPNFRHREFAVPALEAGIHVLLEKPMAANEEDCLAIAEAAKRSGAKLMVAYRLHFEPGTVEMVHRVRAGEIGDICADPSLPVQTLVVAGGDGSVNEALTGFQNHPAPPQLGIIPFGTANVLALELGLPRNAKAIAELIRRGKTRQLHYGLANGRPFVLMASAGFDAEVVHAVPLSLKRRLGKLAYVITALRTGFKRKSASLKVILDGEELTGKLAVASNARHYGGPFVICPDASVTKAGLQMLILEKDDPLSAIRFGLALLLGRVHKARGVKLMPFDRARILSKTPVAVQIDGDPFGTTPVEIEVSRSSLEIVVP